MLSDANVTMNGCGTRPTTKTMPLASPTARPVAEDREHDESSRVNVQVHDRADDAGEGDRRPDREVDPAADDHEQLTEREDRDHRRLREDVPEVPAREEDGRRQADEHDQQKRISAGPARRVSRAACRSR